MFIFFPGSWVFLLLRI